VEEQKGLQLMPERVDGQCRDDIVRQCIPDLGGNWLPIVDSLECVMYSKMVHSSRLECSPARHISNRVESSGPKCRGTVPWSMP